MKTIPQQTSNFIEDAFRVLDNNNVLERNFHRFNGYPWWRRVNSDSIDECANIILELEAMAKKCHQGEMKRSESPHPFPVYNDTIDVVPIYKDAVSLECHRQIVPPSEIPNLAYLLRVPGSSNGVDAENHGFGYHFHYGKIKSEAIERTTLLLTFHPESKILVKPKKGQAKTPPLYGEQHAEGKNRSINMETIGRNKRVPIYLVCLSVSEKRGFENFKTPGANSVVFQEGEADA